MELLQDKRKRSLIIIDLLNLLLSIVLLSFYPYIGIKVIIVFLAVLSILFFFPQRLKSSDYFRRFLIYSGVLIFYIPSALYLNDNFISGRHMVLLLLLLFIFFETLYINGIDFCPSKKELFFILSLFVFMLLIISFVYFSPIREEYAIKAKFLELLYKPFYLLLFFFLLYFNFRSLEYARLTSGSLFLSPERIIIIFLILIISFSVVDTVYIRKEAENCMRTGFVNCRVDPDRIMNVLRYKNLNSQNIVFIKSRIKKEMGNPESKVFELIDSAERMYPYECDFYIMKAEYLKKYGLNERLNEFINNPPAPFKKGCKGFILDNEYNER